MNAATIIAVIALVCIVFFAVRYIVKEKKRGVRCIGCPMAGTCEKYGKHDHAAPAGDGKLRKAVSVTDAGSKNC